MGDEGLQISNGHVWELDEDGTFSYTEVWSEDGFCGGPTCSVCGYQYCQHCHPEGAPDPCEKG
jgi:hypothetical protein